MDNKKVAQLVTRRLLPATGLVGLGLVLANLGAVAVTFNRAYDYVMNTPRTGSIQINIYDGTRTQLPKDAEVLVRVTDGNQKEVLVKYLKGGSINVTDLEWHDNFGDRYTVIVSRSGYKQAGFYPVNLKRGQTVSVDLMLLPKNYRINFDAASWDQIKLRNQALYAMLSSGLSDQDARIRYEKLLKDQPLVAAHLFNVAGALSNVTLLNGDKILPYYKQAVFDSSMKQDNFFAYVDKRLAPALRNEVAKGKTWEHAAGSQVFHGGNTGSFKELSFWEANVQITFYEQDTKIIDGVECVRIETDIDYYRDPAAHVILEVFVNKLGDRLTDPLEAYQLRFIASRSTSGGPLFDPLYTVELKK